MNVCVHLYKCLVSQSLELERLSVKTALTLHKYHGILNSKYNDEPLCNLTGPSSHLLGSNWEMGVSSPQTGGPKWLDYLYKHLPNIWCSQPQTHFIDKLHFFKYKWSDIRNTNLKNIDKYCIYLYDYII